MRVSLVAFTDRGVELARSLGRGLAGRGWQVDVSCPERLVPGRGPAEPLPGAQASPTQESFPQPVSGAQAFPAQEALPQADGVHPGHVPEVTVLPYASLDAWARASFAASDALVFVSACGIAVRAVAPLVEDKYRDPAVVCVDERCRFAIPLLSGHVGGANDLARTIGLLCGAEPVITTATDLGGVFAVDAWARDQGMTILDREVAKAVSARLLEGGTVGIAGDVAVEGPLPEGLVPDPEGACGLGISVSLGEGRPFPRTLRLVPRLVTVGIGCRRGTPLPRLEAAVAAALELARVSPHAVAAIATIDAKRGEGGLIELARQKGVPLALHSAEELAGVPGTFSSSDFVRRAVGVDNVCERAACAAGERLLLSRQAADGVTVALGISRARLAFPEDIRPEEDLCD